MKIAYFVSLELILLNYLKERLYFIYFVLNKLELDQEQIMFW